MKKQEVIIYLSEERAVKRLGKNYGVDISGELLSRLRKVFGEEQVKLVDKKLLFT